MGDNKSVWREVKKSGLHALQFSFFRPVALAWEIRKSSPGKSLSSSQNKETLKPTDGVSRTLNFTGQK